MARVIVVGAGVVGLTCAVRLATAGHRVDLLARDLPRETTSAVAGALWYPGPGGQAEREAAWARRSHEMLCELAEDQASGVRLLVGTVVSGAPAPEPAWLADVTSPARETSLPAGYADGWTFTAPVVDMPVHLDHLANRLEALGGTITRMNLSSLPPTGTAPGGVDVVVDCAGLGARLFAADDTLVPVRGQVVVLEQTGLDRWWLAEGEQPTYQPTYVVPRAGEIVVGTTWEQGEWSRTPDPGAAATEIVERAARLVPALAGARVLRHRVGLRPSRPRVRVERVGDVVHCYGHGGAGVTLGWGCAEEVLALVG